MRAIVTGAHGLIGSHVSHLLLSLGHRVFGIDNDSRAVFFGQTASTANGAVSLRSHANYTDVPTDVSDCESVNAIVAHARPDLVIHAAAQPSHDRAAEIPFLDAQTNIIGTLTILEAIRRRSPQATFIHLSTNKVYGDHPNAIPLIELESRYDYADGRAGITEDTPVVSGVHSLFGVSKLAAEAYVTEYGKNFGLRTCSLRGGCLTGPGHASVQAHGFMSYMINCFLNRSRYTVFGYKGKQVRDQLHAADVADLILAIMDSPFEPGSVFNIGGGRSNSASVIECIDIISQMTGLKLDWSYSDKHRTGDHVCYITDNSAISAITGWSPTRSIEKIVTDIIQQKTK